jgi:hypothetical protein
MLKLSAIAAIIAVCRTASFAVDVPFDDVLKNYSRFEDQRVTIVGVAEVHGGDFLLWDVGDRQHKNLKRSISASWDPRLPNYPSGTTISHYTYVNLRRVKVTGVVDTHFHGRWGNLPFQLRLDRVQVLSGGRQRQFLVDIGIFHNAMSAPIQVHLHNRSGFECAEMSGVEPNGSDDSAIEEGFAEITSLSGKPIAKCKISLSGSSKSYYDSYKHAFYYRIANGNRVGAGHRGPKMESLLAGR